MQLVRPDLALKNGLNPFWTGSFFAIVSDPNPNSAAVFDVYSECLQQLWHGKVQFYQPSPCSSHSLLKQALLDANATALQTSYYCLLTLGFLILAGNTCFPPFLRLIIWTGKVCIPRSWDHSRWEKRRQVLKFLLDHPRRCYTHLFPSAQTW
jgi:hypothetical protein